MINCGIYLLIITLNFCIFISNSLNRIQARPKFLIRIKNSVCLLIKSRVFLYLNNLKYFSILNETIALLLNPIIHTSFILNNYFRINKILRNFDLLELLIRQNMHKFYPDFISNFMSKSFFNSTLYSSLTRKHFIFFQT